MGWHTRYTRFGDMHMVFSQEADESCGLACARMIAFKMNKMKLTKTALYREKTLYKKFDKANNNAAGSYDGTVPTDEDEVIRLLNTLHCGVWEAVNVGLAGITDALIDGLGRDFVGLGPINTLKRGSPMIIGVDWVGGGGHWVVADTLNSVVGKMWVSICDPWDGDVHVVPVKKAAAFEYKPKNQSFDMQKEKTDGGAAGGGPLQRVGHAAALLAKGKTSWTIGGPDHAFSNTAGVTGNAGMVIRRRS